jgi:hypothetical protein
MNPNRTVWGFYIYLQQYNFKGLSNLCQIVSLQTSISRDSSEFTTWQTHICDSVCDTLAVLCFTVCTSMHIRDNSRYATDRKSAQLQACMECAGKGQRQRRFRGLQGPSWFRFLTVKNSHQNLEGGRVLRLADAAGYLLRLLRVRIVQRERHRRLQRLRNCGVTGEPCTNFVQ